MNMAVLRLKAVEAKEKAQGSELRALGISLSQGFGLRPTKLAVTAWCREKDKRQKFKDKSKFTNG